MKSCGNISLSMPGDETVHNIFDRFEVKQLQGENEFIRAIIMICITFVKINNVELHKSYKRRPVEDVTRVKQFNESIQ